MFNTNVGLFENMKPVSSKVFDDVLVFHTDIFRDFRGTYVESFNQAEFERYSDVKFVQDDFSSSKRNVFRGLHGDYETWKLVSCVQGEIMLFIADMRDDSPTFLKTESFILTPADPKFVLVPPGFANGHLVLSDGAVFHYKQSTYYGTKQFTVKHNDKRLSLFLPNVKLITSERDS